MNFIIKLLAGCLILSTIALSASLTSCPQFYLDGNSPTIVNEKLTPKTKELCYEAFVVMHSGISKTPLWSAEHLTKEGLENKLPRKDFFHEESRLPKGERAELKDYAHTGYDRGHSAPSADMPTASAQAESFTLANMIPQDHDNNTGIWSSIESATRYLAKKEGSLYVITGPLYRGTLKSIGNGVLVPSMIYKIIYSPKQQKASAYVVNNAQGKAYEVLSIKELESVAGINFFPHMNDAQKSEKLSLPEPKPHQN